MAILDKKISQADTQGEQFKKSFLKSEMQMQNFLDDYLKQRMEFHKY